MVVNIVYPGPEEEARKYTKLFSPYSQSLQEHMLKWQQLPEKSVLGLIPLVLRLRPTIRSVRSQRQNPRSRNMG